MSQVGPGTAQTPPHRRAAAVAVAVAVALRLPGLRAARDYRRSWLRGDVIAGVTVAAYLIPQVMAYAQVAGVPAVAGLWAAMAAIVVYAVLGSSPQLSVGPESTTALMTATVIAPLAAGDPQRYAALTATAALLVGLLCLIGWALRLGFVAELLSRPVLVGYLAGVAVIMMIGQLGRVTGIEVEATSAPGEVLAIVGALDQLRPPTATLAAGVLVLLLVGTRLLPRAPVPLLVIGVAAGVTALLDLPSRGVEVVGTIPAGLPLPQLPPLAPADIQILLVAALGIAVVGYSDNVLTARAFAGRHGDPVDANAELLALGAANLAVATVRGFPVSSSGSRTSIADSLGARSQLYSLVAVLVVAATLLVGGDLLAAFPMAALGAMVVWAALRLIDLGEFRRLARFRRSELVLAMATTAGVLAFDILYGVLVAVALSVLDLLRRVARPHDGVLGYPPGVAGMHDIDDYPGAAQVEGLVVYRYDSPLFFANAADFRSRLTAAVEAAPTPPRWVLINAQANVQVDLTAIDMLEEVRDGLAQRGIELALARVTAEVERELRRAGFWQHLGEQRVFATLPTAVAGYAAWHRDRFGRDPHGLPAPPAAN